MPEIILTTDVTEYGLSPDRTLGGQPEEVASRVSMGRPEPLLVSPALVSDQAEVVEALTRNTGWDFYLIVFFCSFRERDGERIDGATFSVTLRDESGGEHPIAWSLAPDRLTVNTGTTSNDGRVEVGVQFFADLKVSVGHSESHENIEPFVTSYGERESDPEWEYNRTSTQTLNGSQKMALVAQVRAGHRASATYGLTATVSRPRFGIAHVRPELSVPSLTVTFGPEET